MRKTACVAVLASVLIAGASFAGTPAATEITRIEKGLSPIAATFPPLSQDQIMMRCQGFFRAIEVRHKLARVLGQIDLQPFAFLAELPLQRLDRVADNSGADYMTPYMQAFGPINPPRTARMGLFNADRKTCTDFLDAMP